jgi:exoribonuclease II
MEAGKVVAFFEQKRILCAVCLEVKGNKVHLLSEENREITLGLNRIVHASSYSLNLTLPRETLVENLKKALERQKDLMPSISIQELWELVWEERREFSLRELTELIFSSQITFDQEMALFRTLFEDRLYFKQKGELYEPREKEKVEEITLQLEREAEQARELQEAGQWLARVWAGESPPPPVKKEEIISLMKELALYGSDAPNQARGKALL